MAFWSETLYQDALDIGAGVILVLVGILDSLIRQLTKSVYWLAGYQ